MVTRLATSLVNQGLDCIIATLDYREHGPQIVADNVQIMSIPAGTVTRWLRGWSPAFRRRLAAMASENVSVVHSHGLWMLPNLYARQAAIGSHVPLVISPHGMLEEWSFGHNRLRKKMAWNLYERANLKAAALFHATSEAEAASIRVLGLRQPIAIISNGVDLPDLATIPARSQLEKRFPELAGKQWLLFLSRIHPKKGVAELLRVWGKLAASYPDWQLVIAGQDLDDYSKTIMRQAAVLELTNRVTFTGMLIGEDKVCAMGNAGLFVLPTHSENFGLVVAEALAHGVPVVTTTAAPWRNLIDNRCGWWIEPGEAELLATLTHAMGLSAEERRAMGSRGRDMVERNYAWTRVAAEMKSAYAWLCKVGPRPGCVETD